MKHTEGPWSTNHVGFTYAKNGACIAEVGIDVLPFEEVEANGRLIDASPDLLSALEEVFIIGDRLVSDVYGSEFVAKAKAAIAKARGNNQ